MSTNSIMPTVLILCSSERTALQQQVDMLEASFLAYGGRVILYGVTMRRREGFILVELPSTTTALPASLLYLLQNGDDILDFVVYGDDGDGSKPEATTDQEEERPI